MTKRRRKRSGYSERLSVGFTPEQMQHKTDLIRDALNLYLSQQDDIPGTRAAITRKLEGRLDVVEKQLQRQNSLLERIANHLRKKRGA